MILFSLILYKSAIVNSSQQLTIRGINGESEVIEQSAPSNNLHEKDM
jgi:hypothetical protein